MGNVTTGSNYSNTTKYTTTPNGKTFKIEVENGGIVDYSKPSKMSGVIKALGAKGLDLGAQIASGYISDYFNQRSENRADERNRRLIKDTPMLQVEGRRAAGLNPYTTEGAQLPGMSAQSQTDTSSNSDFLNDLMMQERLELDRELAESQIRKNLADANQANANANATTGEESRKVESWEHNLSIIKSKAKDAENQAEISYYERRLKEYTFENDKALSDESVNQARNLTAKLAAETAESNATADEKRQAINESIERAALLKIQRMIQEKYGMSIAFAEIQERWANVNNLNAQSRKEYAFIGEIEEKKNLLKAQTAGQLAENAEIPKNARAKRWDTYVNGSVDSLCQISDSVLGYLTFGISKIGNTTNNYSNGFDSSFSR